MKFSLVDLLRAKFDYDELKEVGPSLIKRIKDEVLLVPDATKVCDASHLKNVVLEACNLKKRVANRDVCTEHLKYANFQQLAIGPPDLVDIGFDLAAIKTAGFPDKVLDIWNNPIRLKLIADTISSAGDPCNKNVLESLVFYTREEEELVGINDNLKDSLACTREEFGAAGVDVSRLKK